MAGPPGRSIPLSRRRTLGGWWRSRRWLRDFRDIPGNAPGLPVQDGHTPSGLFPRPAATVSGVQPAVGAVADSGFAQFFTSNGNGTCACRTRYGGIPTKPGPPPTAHPPSTPSMISSRITGAQTHRPGRRCTRWPTRRCWSIAGGRVGGGKGAGQGAPGAGVHQTTYQGGVGAGPAAGQDPGTAEKVQSGAAGGGPEDAGRGCQPAADCRRLRVFPQPRPAVVPAGRCDTMIRATTVASSQPHPPRGLAGKPLAGFRATPSRRIPVLCGMIVSVIRFNNQLLHR